jgi:putative transposase
MLIEPGNKFIRIYQQCSLIKLSHSSYYYHPLKITEEELEIMNLIDKIYTSHPFFGVRKITDQLRKQRNLYNHKRIYRLMRIMGIEALTPKKNLSKPGKDHLVYPYLLRNVRTTETNQVWSSDITYLPIYKGYAYLVAVIDWFSRYILSWSLSNSLDVYFCLEAL